MAADGSLKHRYSIWFAKEEENTGSAQTSVTKSVDDCINIKSPARKNKPVVKPSSNLMKVLAENISLREQIMYLEKEMDDLQSRLEKEASISTHQRRTVTRQNRAYQCLLNAGTGGSNSMMTSSDKLEAIGMFIFAVDMWQQWAQDDEGYCETDHSYTFQYWWQYRSNKGKSKECSGTRHLRYGMKKGRVENQVLTSRSNGLAGGTLKYWGIKIIRQLFLHK